MATQASILLNTVAHELNMPEEELLREGVRSFLARRLRAVKADILAIHGRYGVKSVEEMEARYMDGTLEEADSWRDLQQLDHLEYERDRLQKLLGDEGCSPWKNQIHA
jgi:hypothetical protein